MGDGTADAALFVLMGSHLFDLPHVEPFRGSPIFMAEDVGLCTVVRHHKQKLVLFLSAMRSQRDALRAAGHEVEYHALEDPDGETPFLDRLTEAINRRQVRTLVHFEVEDRFFDSQLRECADRLSLKRVVVPSPMFLTDEGQRAEMLRGNKPPRMGDFYRAQRLRLGLLLDTDKSPLGGRWSFDEDNRRRLPAAHRPVAASAEPATAHTKTVSALVNRRFGQHPGTTDGFAWPTTREAAMRWLDDFIRVRLGSFGPYEDAISTRDPVLFHSRLTPLLNCGLLTPREVIDCAIARQRDVPLQSLEGFVRQVIGWREFVRGVDQLFGERQASANAWEHTRTLRACWWEGDTGVPPLDDLIAATRATGWAHHIQRLMVAGNIMTLTGVRPDEAHRWFMEMFVDSAEWVMGPNVYGMGICSDGGLFATKPYICGSNYLLKMSDYTRGEWCDGLDGLYWGFVERNRDRLIRNGRMLNTVRSLDRLDPARRDRIMKAGEALRERLTAA